MANTKEIKERIASITETRKITNAMYLISSSKMRQAKEKLQKTEPFFFAMQEEINRILCHWPEIDNQYFDQRPKIPKEDRKVGIIAITADKGLAGAYNHNVIKEVEKMMQWPEREKLFVLGEVGRHYFAKLKGKKELDVDFRFTVQNPTLSRSRRISTTMISYFLTGELDEIHMIYTKTSPSMTSTTEKIKLLPLHKMDFGQTCDIEDHRRGLTFYPSPGAVMDSIVPNYLNGVIYGALVESFYSEHSSRMIAMQNATDNATDMLEELNLTYNKARQGQITQELIEVTAGANAQKGR